MLTSIDTLDPREGRYDRQFIIPALLRQVRGQRQESSCKSPVQLACHMKHKGQEPLYQTTWKVRGETQACPASTCAPWYMNTCAPTNAVWNNSPIGRVVVQFPYFINCSSIGTHGKNSTRKCIFHLALQSSICLMHNLSSSSASNQPRHLLPIPEPSVCFSIDDRIGKMHENSRCLC